MHANALAYTGSLAGVDGMRGRGGARQQVGLCSGRRCPEAARRRLSTTRWLRDSTLLTRGRGGREREKERALCIEESTNTWGNLVAVADMCDHSYRDKLEGE